MSAAATAATAATIDPELMRAHAGDAARLLKALANDRRLMILCLLIEGEMSVGEINARVGLSQSALSQHLALLRAEGLVSTRREAQTIHYSVAPGPAHALIATLHDIYCVPAPVKAGPRSRARAARA